MHMCFIPRASYITLFIVMMASLVRSHSFFQYRCFAAPFLSVGRNGEQAGWWTGSNGTKHYYWNGDHSPDRHVCACGTAGTCVDSALACNCDAAAPQWLEDSGRLTSAAGSLPVVELRFGGLRFDGQAAQFQLGPLACSGRNKVIIFSSFSHSFSPLSLSLSPSLCLTPSLC
jgi:hypothetical protein